MAVPREIDAFGGLADKAAAAPPSTRLHACRSLGTVADGNRVVTASETTQDAFGASELASGARPCEATRTRF
jgi:hypothetical protein